MIGVVLLKLVVDDHGSGHTHGVNGVDPDPVWTEELGVTPHETHHAVLRGAVGGNSAAAVVHTAQTGSRARDDDGASCP